MNDDNKGAATADLLDGFVHRNEQSKNKQKPIYFLELITPVGNITYPKYVVVKINELTTGYISFIGFTTYYSFEQLKQNFVKIVNETNKDLYLELIFPWHVVHYVSNLTYKQK